MFKVQANSLDEYFDADPARKADLLAMDALIRKTVPGLELDLSHRLVIRTARLRDRQRWYASRR